MSSFKKQTHFWLIMNLIRALARKGLRVFSLEDAFETLKEQGLSESYAKKVLSLMAKKGDLQVLGKGLYGLPTDILSGGPLHPFEIAMKIVKKGAISHRSALFFHDMTDQMLKTVYITVPKVAEANLSTKSTYTLQETLFQVKRVTPQKFFGVKRFFIGEVPVWITDVEKTLLDGLSDPSLCGGFREVLHAFSKAGDIMNPQTLYSYSQKSPVVVSKRLGWVLEKLTLFPDLQQKLEEIPIKTLQKLNPTGPRKGHANKRWMVTENI